MQEINFDEAVELIFARDSRYPREAYVFVREALDYTQKLVGKETRGAIRHVSGQELLEGIRKFALNQFGPMTATVFEEWNIRHCRDFGEIVFNMVDSGILGKNERDNRDDFKGGYDFDEVFVKPYQPPRSRRVRHADTPPRTGAECFGEGKRSADATELSGGAN